MRMSAGAQIGRRCKSLTPCLRDTACNQFRPWVLTIFSIVFSSFSDVLVFYTYWTTHWDSCSESPVKPWDDSCQTRQLSMSSLIHLLLCQSCFYTPLMTSLLPLASLSHGELFCLVIFFPGGYFLSLSSIFQFYYNLLEREESNYRRSLQVLCRLI